MSTPLPNPTHPAEKAIWDKMCKFQDFFSFEWHDLQKNLPDNSPYRFNSDTLDDFCIGFYDVMDETGFRLRDLSKKTTETPLKVLNKKVSDEKVPNKKVPNKRVLESSSSSEEDSSPSSVLFDLDSDSSLKVKAPKDKVSKVKPTEPVVVSTKIPIGKVSDKDDNLEEPAQKKQKKEPPIVIELEGDATIGQFDLACKKAYFRNVCEFMSSQMPFSYSSLYPPLGKLETDSQQTLLLVALHPETRFIPFEKHGIFAYETFTSKPIFIGKCGDMLKFVNGGWYCGHSLSPLKRYRVSSDNTLVEMY